MKLYKIILPVPVICAAVFLIVQHEMHLARKAQDLKDLANVGITEQSYSKLTEETDMEPQAPDYKHMTKKELAVARAQALKHIWVDAYEQ